MEDAIEVKERRERSREKALRRVEVTEVVELRLKK